MTHVRRKANGKKQRKIIFRAMKKLSACIAKHAKRYRELLNKEWEKTNWTDKQAKQVIQRLDAILQQLSKHTRELLAKDWWQRKIKY